MSVSHASSEPESPTRQSKPRRRWLVWLRRVVILLIVIFLALVYVVFPLWASGLVTRATTRPMDRRLTSTPRDFQAEYRDVEFTTADGVRLSGWLLPSRERHATIIFSHGLFRSRRELLERAVDLWRLGYGALLYDARNHGDSGAARVTLGYDERLDAEAAVRYLRDEVHTTDKIVLFGISMGAMTALLAAAETPEVAAVISDSSYLNFKDTSDHHIRLFLHLPAFPLANEIRALMERRGQFDGDKLDATDAVRRIGERPAMFIAAANDPRMPPDIAEKLYDVSASDKRKLAIIDGPGSEIHGHAYQANPQRYVSEIAAFLKDALE
ncbi:MAG TPA: alpha/beta fold hydrolase [Blastocatellia bacterium]|nr:alpha/beta fold hydrolase [Blastocatellia bacterium]